MQSEAKVNVLMVDDHPENLLVLEEILGGLGQNLVKAHSGEEALRCLLQQDFAVILLDVQMPGMDGFETATLIRQRERSRNTPIIFLTAFSTSDALMFKGYALGAVDYLLKPIDPTILTSKVSVFVDLFKKTMEVKRQAAQLTAINSELKQSEERFRSLSACSPVGIFLTDTAGRCTYTNPTCQEICGFKIEESWEAEWAKFIHPQEGDRAIAQWSQSTRRGQSYSDEFRIVTPAGDERWVHIRTSPMLSDRRQLMGHVCTIEDITERKEAEAARDQIIREQAARQQAETANRLKDEFLAIVSHELRTPLNSILGWARLLLTRKFDPATITRALETIERNARSQARLIEDILDVSQIIRGKLRLSIQPLNAIGLIEAVVETVRPLAEAKKIQLEAILDPAAKFVSGDPERLRQIVGNLLSNAIKFTPESGKVEVKLSTVMGDGSLVMGNREEDSSPNSKHQLPVIQYAQIQVIDTGIGIKSDFLPQVFDRFTQADSTFTRSYGGLGLGLAIANHLVALHGGKIYAESDGEGKGATFTVNLPLMATSKAASESEPENSRHNNGKGQEHISSLERLQVLVVEDNTDTRDFIKMVLEQAGAKVTAVASVREAMNCLQKSSPHVLVSDIGMPEEDGYSLIRKVRDFEAQKGEKIPAIALTAYAKIEDRMLALNAGFQMHIPKPVEPSELVKVVAKVAGRSNLEPVE